MSISRYHMRLVLPDHTQNEILLVRKLLEIGSFEARKFAASAFMYQEKPAFEQNRYDHFLEAPYWYNTFQPTLQDVYQVRKPMKYVSVTRGIWTYEACGFFYEKFNILEKFGAMISPFFVPDTGCGIVTNGYLGYREYFAEPGFLSMLTHDPVETRS